MAAPSRVISSSRSISSLTVAHNFRSKVSIGRAAGTQWHRAFQTGPSPGSQIPDFAFAFDIDGVLVRSSDPLPGASKALKYLQQERIPFILLTNGGGKSEAERVRDLSDKLDVQLDTGMFIQSHTPFAEMNEYHDKTVLVVGGEGDKCQKVAHGYGFKNVVTPGDILAAYPEIWPFSQVFLKDYYGPLAKPLPLPINPADPEASLKIDAIFVYNDPRDWGLDSTVILDLLLSRNGILGTTSSKNGDRTLINNGYLQDSQPPLFYSNPDLWFAAAYPLPRLGQGGFRESFNGLWASATNGAKLRHQVFGKPGQEMYEFAEGRLRAHRKTLFNQVGLNDPLRRVYMVGDNPESDIRGANDYESPHGSDWTSVLIKTGVYKEGTEPSCRPHVIRENVWDAVQWAMKDAQRAK